MYRAGIILGLQVLHHLAGLAEVVVYFLHALVIHNLVFLCLGGLARVALALLVVLLVDLEAVGVVMVALEPYLDIGKVDKGVLAELAASTAVDNEVKFRYRYPGVALVE